MAVTRGRGHAHIDGTGSDNMEALMRSNSTNMHRRRLLVGIGQLAGAAAITTSVPALAKQMGRVRVIGSSDTLRPRIGRPELDVVNGRVFMREMKAQNLYRTIFQLPTTYDVAEINFDQSESYIRGKAFQPIDIRRIKMWDAVWETLNITEYGGSPPAGDGPLRWLWVDSAGLPSSDETGFISALPVAISLETLAFLPDEKWPWIDSWGALIDPEFSGDVAITSDPTTGIIDLGMAARATGKLSISTLDELSDMSRDLIDDIVELAVDLRQRGHFHRVIESRGTGIRLMSEGKVRVQTMESFPALLAGASSGARYDVLREGYRGVGRGLALSPHLRGSDLDLAYEYINWRLSDGVAAQTVRHGLYPVNINGAKNVLSAGEWNYWCLGLPAQAVLLDSYGKPIVNKGWTRAGTGYINNLSRVSIWNSRFKEHQYLLKRWANFLEA